MDGTIVVFLFSSCEIDFIDEASRPLSLANFQFFSFSFLLLADNISYFLLLWYIVVAVQDGG